MAIVRQTAISVPEQLASDRGFQKFLKLLSEVCADPERFDKLHYIASVQHSRITVSHVETGETFNSKPMR